MKLLDIWKYTDGGVPAWPCRHPVPTPFTRHVALIDQPTSWRPIDTNSGSGRLADSSGARFDGTRCIAAHGESFHPRRTPAHRIGGLSAPVRGTQTVDELHSRIAGRDRATNGSRHGS